MIYVNSFADLFVGTLLQQFARPWPGLVAIALATSIAMLLVIRWTSSPAVIRRTKNRLTARVLELVLFRHDAVVSSTALGRILAANLAYLRTMLRPLLFSALPCLLILSQLSCWFSARPLQVGETALVEVTLRDDFPLKERPVSLSAPDFVQIETDPLRIPRLSEVDWRLRARREGVDFVEIHAGDEAPIRKQIVVGDTLRKVSLRRTGRGLWEQFLHPVESPIERGHAVVQVAVRYPPRQLYLGSTAVDWLAAFLALTIVFSLILKRPLRVQF